MRELPSGAVTLLFTDVEGSTRLLHDLGPDRYAEALVEHRRVVRACCSRHGGVEVDTQGDAFFVAFPSAPAAVAAAADVQNELGAGPINVRMGMHTGRPHVVEQGYVGEDVHLGARVSAIGHGGQVLLTEQTRKLVDAEVTDLGEHRLKDFDVPVAIFQLGDRRFPPLRTVANTNLPRPASSFLGREREVAEVVEVVRDGARLVTLTGSGGTGKTRLAIESAAELVGEFKAGVFWVGLATVRDPALVPDAVAQALGARSGLAEFVGERELLLLLDNFEQVVEAAPDLSALLEACPNLCLLVTSRELLRIRGEVEYPVPPLAEPDAVELFCARSRLEPDETVRELCRRLDNLPLAVELAAARASVLTPAQILERLSQRLDLLKSGRDVEPRQQTLRATIEWSYDLLSEEEKRLFADLAVFAGGCTVEAAEVVCEASLDTLQSLVEKSLVRRTRERFWMLETIREYAGERLAESGELESLRPGLLDHLLEVAESAKLGGEVAGAGTLAVVRDEVDNVRAVLAWALDAAPEAGLRLALALEGFWPIHSPIEGMRWYESLLARAVDAPLALRAAGWRAYGGSANPAGRDELAERAYEESLAGFRSLGDEQQATELVVRLGYAAFYRGDLGRARALAEEALASPSLAERPHRKAIAVGLLGEVEVADGNAEAGVELMERSAARAADCGFVWWRAGMLGKLSDHARELGRVEEARRQASEALLLSRDLGDRLRMTRGLARLARLAAEQGEAVVAGRLWGSVEAEEAREPIGAWENERHRFAAVVLAREGPEFERGRADGRAMPLDEAVGYALSIDSRS